MVHIVPNVLLASVIGVQQSAYTAQRILEDLERQIAGAATPADDIPAELQLWQEEPGIDNHERAVRAAVVWQIMGLRNMPSPPVPWREIETDWNFERGVDEYDIKAKQVKAGAVHSFRPDRWKPNLKKGRYLHNILAFAEASWIDVLAILIVSSPAIGGTILAVNVPPEGMNCRAFVKLLMVGTYWVKFLAQLWVNRLSDGAMEVVSGWLERVVKWLSRGLEGIGLPVPKTEKQPPVVVKMMVTAVFDAIAFLFFATIIFSTQSGNLNRPGCYSESVDGVVKAVFSPKDTWPIVQARMRTVYPGILFGLLGGIVLGVCPLLVFFFRDAKDVFLQEDRPWTPKEWREVLQGTRQGNGDQGVQNQQERPAHGAPQAPAEATSTRVEEMEMMPVMVDRTPRKKDGSLVTVTRRERKGHDVEQGIARAEFRVR